MHTYRKTPFADGSPALLVLLVAAFTGLRVLWLFVAPLPLFGDEAQYWLWAQSPDWGYYSKPPLMAWVIALTTAIGGDSEAWLRLASPLAHGASALLVYAAATPLMPARAAFWAGLLYLTLPAVFFSSLLISTDPFLLLFWAAALACLVRAPGNPRWWLGTGACLGLGLLAKYTMLFFAIGILLTLLLVPRYRRTWRSIWLYSGLALSVIIILPNILWNAGHGWLTLQHTGENAHWQGLQMQPVELLAFWGSQLAVFGPVLLVLLVLTVTRYGRTLAGQSGGMLLLFVLPLLLAISVQAVLSRANANWAAPAYIGGCMLVALMADSRFWQRWLQGSVLGHTALALSALLLMLPPPGALPAAFDPLKRLRGYPGLAAHASEVLAQLPPGTGVLTNHRMLSGLLLYYGRPSLTQLRKWNPDTTIDDSFEMPTAYAGSLTPTDTGHWLLVSPYAPDALLPCFADVRRLPDYRATIHPKEQKTFTLTHVSGFRGYDACR